MGDYSAVELINLIQMEYCPERMLKQRDGSCVTLIRRKSDSSRWIFREYEGDGSVYRKLQQVRCPHLPAIEQVEESGGLVQVLETYVQGDSLQFLLQGDTLSEREAETVALQLCEALEVLHGFGAVHRDIKPENVLLAGDRAILIDFDASRIEKPDQSGDTRVMGTIGYAAPEQYGLSQTDARTDLYAMGVLMNVMLTGQHPSQTLASGRLRPIILKCISVNADRRYPSAEALAKAIRNSRSRTWRWIMGLLTAIAVICSIMWVSRSKPSPLPDPPVPYVEPQSPAEIPEPEIKQPPAAEPEVLLPAEPEPDPRQQELEQTITQHRDLPEKYQTHFFYDLDGDGIEEPYIFAPYILTFADKFIEWDNVWFRPAENGYPRTAAPGVWRQLPDGGFEPVEAFAALLEAPKTLLYCVEQNGEDLPEVYPEEPLEGIWQGGASLHLSPEAAGLWLFRFTARLGDLELEGSMVSEVEIAEEPE